MMAEITILPRELQEAIESEMGPEETIAWCARPRASRFAWRAMPLVLVGLPFTAVVLFWFVGITGAACEEAGKGETLFVVLFGMPFLLIGLGMLSAPLWMIRKARRTVYAVTNRRALILERGRNLRVHSFGPEALHRVEKRVKSDGSGDLIFERRLGAQGGTMTFLCDLGFFGVENVDGVEAALRGLVEKGGPPG